MMTKNNGVAEPKKSSIDVVVKYIPEEKHILAQLSEPVTEFDDELVKLVDRMSASLYFYEALGISAIQIGVPKRVFLIKTSVDAYAAVVNPEITKFGEKTDIQMEGCLSFPSIFVPVERSTDISVKFQSLQGELQELDLSGLQARAFAHEYDHLRGITFLDRVSPLKRSLVLEKMRKIQKNGKIKKDELAVKYIEAMAAQKDVENTNGVV